MKLYEQRDRTDEEFLHNLEKETELFRKKVTGCQSKLSKKFGFGRRSVSLLSLLRLKNILQYNTIFPLVKTVSRVVEYAHIFTP